MLQREMDGNIREEGDIHKILQISKAILSKKKKVGSISIWDSKILQSNNKLARNTDT
jgi:hypothetical protein